MQTAWFVCWFRYEIFSDGQEAQLKRSAAWVVRPSPALFGKANSASGGGPAAEAPAAAAAAANRSPQRVAERSGGPSVGSAVAEGATAGQEMAKLRREREVQRRETTTWLRRVVSKLSGVTLGALKGTEAKFGDTITFKGHDYSSKLTASTLAM